MTMKTLCDSNRVETAAGLIATELRKFVTDDWDDAGDSLPRLGACSIDVKGLTRGEYVHAIVRALGLVQLEMLAELGAMQFEGVDHDDDEDRPPPHQFMSDSELLKHLGQGPAPII